MGLPTGQQRVLEKIEGKLAESDPRLAALFVIFDRLTRAEAMPWFEQIRVRPLRDRLARTAGWLRRFARCPAARVRALVVVPAALAAMACALTIAFGFSGGQRPSSGSRVHASRQLVVRHRVCRMGLIRIPALAC
jgi:hypothetical protein